MKRVREAGTAKSHNRGSESAENVFMVHEVRTGALAKGWVLTAQSASQYNRTTRKSRKGFRRKINRISIQFVCAPNRAERLSCTASMTRKKGHSSTHRNNSGVIEGNTGFRSWVHIQCQVRHLGSAEYNVIIRTFLRRNELFSGCTIFSAH